MLTDRKPCFDSEKLPMIPLYGISPILSGPPKNDYLASHYLTLIVITGLFHAGLHQEDIMASCPMIRKMLD